MSKYLNVICLLVICAICTAAVVTDRAMSARERDTAARTLTELCEQYQESVIHVDDEAFNYFCVNNKGNENDS